MGLSEDSRTLLQLLLGRGKTYGDIAGLLGIDETEVRSRAHQALTEINGSDPDRDVNLTDYLLGQCDPIGRADVARELAGNEEAAETASSLAEQLSLLVPGAELPRAGQPAKAAAPRAPKPPSLRPRRKTSAGTDDAPAGSAASASQKRLIVILVLAAFLVLAGVLFLTGVFGGDDSDKNPP
ncbi:MAG: hypothetical protein M3Y23_05470, partial [Actinomycetota bacterium]|nr:hypothetical protein [Actinomycetota bacterium]